MKKQRRSLTSEGKSDRHNIRTIPKNCPETISEEEKENTQTLPTKMDLKNFEKIKFA
jgi:ribosomal protein S20